MVGLRKFKFKKGKFVAKIFFSVGLVHKYGAVFGSFVDIGIVVTFLSFT